MEYLSVAAAQQCVLEAVSAFGTEQVKLEQSLGRVLAEEVRANRDQPPYDISAMDGYALCSADLGSIPATLEIIEDIKAGDMPFVVPEVVELLAGYRSRHQAVVPVVHGHPQPLAAFYAASCLAPLRASLAAQQKGLRGVLKQLDVRYVDEAEMLKADPHLRSFFDLDTPQDVAQAMNQL